MIKVYLTIFQIKIKFLKNKLTFFRRVFKEKYGENIQTSEGLYYLSDLNYSQSRNNIVNCLKKDKITDIVYLKYHLKLTDAEINCGLFS